MRTKTVIGLVASGVVLVYLFAPIGVKLHKLKSQERALEQNVRQLVSESIVLENELRLLTEDPVYVENIARRTFRRAKDGEIVYKFVTLEELEQYKRDRVKLSKT